MLFVREAKEIHRGQWNFPGGHVELGEHPGQAAIREVREETCLDVSLRSIVGVYSGLSPGLQTIRFVFKAVSYSGVARPGDEILEVKWMSLEEILGMNDSELVGARFLRRIVQDWQAGRSYPLEVISDL
jgi:8-oxo-dGTP diphosphatase